MGDTRLLNVLPVVEVGPVHAGILSQFVDALPELSEPQINKAAGDIHAVEGYPQG
jgi:hypothetical protein